MLLNDAEIRELTGEPNLPAARALTEMGPRVVVAKRGEYGAALFCATILRDPRLPVRGCPRSHRGRGQLRGRVPRLPRQPPGRGRIAADHAVLRQAMAYGTVLASFNVEDFGERVRSRPARRSTSACASSAGSRCSRGTGSGQPGTRTQLRLVEVEVTLDPAEELQVDATVVPHGQQGVPLGADQVLAEPAVAGQGVLDRRLRGIAGRALPWSGRSGPGRARVSGPGHSRAPACRRPRARRAGRVPPGSQRVARPPRRAPRARGAQAKAPTRRAASVPVPPASRRSPRPSGRRSGRGSRTRARVERERQRQRGGERDGAAHSAPPDQQALAPVLPFHQCRPATAAAGPETGRNCHTRRTATTTAETIRP